MPRRKYKRRPRIGITTGEKANPVMLFALKWAVRLAGGRPVHLSPNRNRGALPYMDGFLISGGSDISPEQYGQTNTASQNLDPDRDILERRCLVGALNKDKPVLGICRGAQMINVALGGTLHQDAPSVFDGFIPVTSTMGKMLVRKKIDITADSRLYNILEQSEELWVNSLHHQAIAEVASGLTVVAQDEYGLVQAIEAESTNNFILGVQWHPELMLYSSAQRRIFRSLVRACRAGMVQTQKAPQPSSTPQPVHAR